MDFQNHYHRVFYKNGCAVGSPYQQIDIVERDGKFEVRVTSGTVTQYDPLEEIFRRPVVGSRPFEADNPDAEAYVHTDLKEAIADAEKECGRAVEDSYQEYKP